MSLYDGAFFLFAAITVLSACIVVFSRNIIYAAFALLFTFFGVSGLYALLLADFLAVAQIVIYVGGILVLMLFGVMLTNKVVSVDLKTGTLQTIPALLIVAALLTSLGALFVSNWSSGTALPSTSVTTARALGEMLLTGYLLPFEVASVVLLVALIGAAFTARRTRNVS